MAAKDITNQRFGKLVALRKSNLVFPDGELRWECICDCGNTKILPGTRLRRGNVKSCGCILKVDQRTHGLAETPEYNIWRHMRDRCSNPNNGSYRDYGGRGIKVCEEWENSFEAFIRDMGPKPGPGYSIERNDNNGNYCKENCRWATKREQANNRRSNVFYEYNGKMMTLAGWCNELNLDYGLVYYRMRAYKWSFEKAIGPKLRVNRK